MKTNHKLPLGYSTQLPDPSTVKHKKEKPELDLTFEDLSAVPKPIVSDEIEEAALDLLVAYKKKEMWRAWGLNKLRKQGSAALFSGPPGTGKTSLARWIAWKLGKGMKSLDVSAIGGGDPGDSERKVHAFFADARKRGNATVFLDECNNLLGDREDSSDDTWKIGTTEALMMEINIYAGLVLCATNLEKKMDPALADRFIAILKIGEPDRSLRKRLWKAKWPDAFPMKLTDDVIVKLSRFELNGRRIENVIYAVGSRCIRKGWKPKLPMFELACQTEQDKHITEGEEKQ